MKKIISFIICAAIMFSGVTAFAQDEITAASKAASAQNEITVDARAAFLIDEASGRVLFEKNADEALPIASVTKIMTLNLIFDSVENGNLSLTDSVKVSENAAGMGGSQAFIDAGYEYTADELIKSIIMASANDCAVAMAERVAGSEEAFVAQMNKKAKELSMESTSFENCTGLPEEGHYSTAGDVAKMSAELVKHEAYFNYSTKWMDELKHSKDGRSTELVNTNKLIRSLSGCDGIKTGSTSEAKFCVSATAKRGDMRLISVVLGGETSKGRFDDAAKLINYGFANYKSQIQNAPNEVVGQVTLLGGTEENINALASKSSVLCVKNDGSDIVETRLNLPEALDAPVMQNQVLGTMTVLLNGETVDEIELVADKDYKKATLWDKIKNIFGFLK